MGTLGVRVTGPAADQQLTPPGLTTPDAADVAELLAALAAQGVTHLALEASSHGIDQRRLDGVRLTAAGFTNLTQDHLDYHGTMDAYRAAKLRLFETLLPRGAHGGAERRLRRLRRLRRGRACMPGQRGHARGRGGPGPDALSSARPLPDGQRLTIARRGPRSTTSACRWPARFQASNALVAAGLCIAGGR